jgi:hypothetical protein
VRAEQSSQLRPAADKGARVYEILDVFPLAFGEKERVKGETLVRIADVKDASSRPSDMERYLDWACFRALQFIQR